jgi:hypothetical protein
MDDPERSCISATAREEDLNDESISFGDKIL